jgi:outer membrane immunogenic protein
MGAVMCWGATGMKTKIVAALAALFLISGSTAHAQVPPNVTGAGANSASATSWVAGIRAGNNWQNGSFVFGIETDAQATTLNSKFNSLIPLTVVGGPLFDTGTAMTKGEVEWYGTARARVGWAPGPWLLYATGGLAYGTVDVSSTVTGFGVSLGSQNSESRIGWVAGGGIEYLVRPNVILSAAYQYVDLGTVSLATSGFPIPTATIFLSQSVNDHAHFQVATIGVSWLFSPSDKGSHGSWEGEYIGAHAGGAWGNPTDAAYSGSALFFSDIRLKRDITLLGRLDDGLSLYSYRYLWSDTVYVGVMAQEVAVKMPNAVMMGDDGYLRVDYSKLGLRMRTLAEWEALTYGIRL